MTTSMNLRESKRYNSYDTPQLYNNWYQDPPTNDVNHSVAPPTARCGCFRVGGYCCHREKAAAPVPAPAPTPAPMPASTNAMASYGLYGHHEEDDDDDGFLPRYRYQHSVVSMGPGPAVTTSVAKASPAKEAPECDAHSAGRGWTCCRTGTEAPRPAQTRESNWCRPTMLLLLVVLLLVVFVLISGILLYYNYVTYKPIPPTIEEPCEKLTCPWGSDCEQTEGSARCRCPDHCPGPASGARPACGTDGVSYASLCALRSKACRHRDGTRLLHMGECETDTDSCTALTCPPGARCVPSDNGVTCQCNADCGSPSRQPVCGSDGSDYVSLCELRYASCLNHSDISVRYLGRCDPCEDIQCNQPEVCQLDGDRNPVCRCGETCSLELAPVCATDGKTYSNECQLRQESCRTRLQLRILYHGMCSEGSNPCLSLQCLGPGEQCSINKLGLARCECPPHCEPVLKPVCGNDSLTYSSACELRRTSCLANKAVQIIHTGACGSMGPCSTYNCGRGAECVERKGSAMCECVQCSGEFDPVCGTDGSSYSNACQLRAEACLRDRDVTVLHPGLCDGCEGHKCKFYGVCEYSSSGGVRCICPETCLESGESVCGSDNTTYESECRLRQHSCKTQQLLFVSYIGACDVCHGVHCDYGTHCDAGECVCSTDCPQESSETVCASNMLTYSNLCEMQKASCATEEALEILFYGECEEKFSVSTPATMEEPHSLQTVEPDEPIMQLLPDNDLDNDPWQISQENTVEAEREACNDIQCDFEATCRLGPDDFPHCTCQFDCSSARDSQQVCASDMRMYASECAMKMEACQRQQELRLRPKELCQGMEVKPCNGQPPLVNPLTGAEYDCGSGPNRQDCPSSSYCHQTAQFARCCRKGDYLTTTTAIGKPNVCEDSWFGCCPDGKTPAQGAEFFGCPSHCGCNKLGSVSDACEPETKQCMCKPGVGGLKCDRCEPGFWGLPKISEGHQGCLPCGCSSFGSVRDDCEQMTGRCMCKPGVQGQKCTVCTGLSYILGPTGCVSSEELLSPGTERPVRRSTVLRSTEPEMVSSPLYKSTRHLLTPSHRYFYHHTSDENEAPHPASLHQFEAFNNTNYMEERYQPTPATMQAVLTLLGESCSTDLDCGVHNSWCVSGECLCKDGFKQMADRRHCRAYLIPAFDGSAYVQMKRIKAYHKLSVDVEFSSYTNNGIILYNQQMSDGTGDFVSLAIVNGFVEFRYNLGNGPVAITSTERIQLKYFHHVTAKRYHRDGMLRLDDGEFVAGQSQGALRSLDLREDAFIGHVPTNASKVYENIGINHGFVGCIRLLRLGRHHIELHEGLDQQIIHTFGLSECGYNPCASAPCHNGATCHSSNGKDFHCICSHQFTGVFCESRANLCLSSPCIPGSRCEALPEGGFTCECSSNFNEGQCNSYQSTNMEGYIPAFNGKSFLELPRLEGVGQAFALEMWFLSNSLEGILLYNTQLESGKGDFISLRLVSGHIQFQFDLGSGPANITSEEVIELGQWHSVKISRLDREGTLQLDKGAVSYGSSGPPLNELNLELPLYLGGLPMSYQEDGMVNGLNGAVQRLVVNGQHLNIFGNTEYPNLWRGPPCLDNICNNGGTCIPILGNYSCRCPATHIGLHCEIYLGDRSLEMPIRFLGDTYYRIEINEIRYNISTEKNETNIVGDNDVEYDFVDGKEKNYADYDMGSEADMYDEDDIEFFDKDKHYKYGNKYSFVFRTKQLNGLLLWHSWNEAASNAHLAILIIGGFLQLSIRHNSYITAKSQIYVSDGLWHSVSSYHTQHQAVIQIDEENPVRINTIDPLKIHESNLWIGGVPTVTSDLLPVYYSGFKGCIDNLRLLNIPINIKQHVGNNSIVQVCLDNDE